MWGMGVASRMVRTSRPAVANARTADSLPEPGPLTRTSTLRNPLSDGRTVTKELVSQTIPEELDKIRGLLGEGRFKAGKFDLAAKLYEQMMTSDQFDEFLTLKAYQYV